MDTIAQLLFHHGHINVINQVCPTSDDRLTVSDYVTPIIMSHKESEFVTVGVQPAIEEIDSTADVVFFNDENVLFSDQNIRIIKDEGRSDCTTALTASFANNDLIQLKLLDNKDDIIHEALSTQIMNTELNTSIQIVCLNVDSLFMNLSEKNDFPVKSYDNNLQCVSDILSNKEAQRSLIYFVTYISKGEFIVPLIHENSYVERVYLYHDPGDEKKTNWMKKYSKIVGVWSSINKIEEQLIQDIKLTRERSIRWTRSQELFVELWQQQSSPLNQTITTIVNGKMFDSRQIVILFCDNRDKFCLSYNYAECLVFDDIQCCSNSIEEQEKSSIFLIICGISENNLTHVQPLIEKHCIHATYIVRSPTHPKISNLSMLYENFRLCGMFSSYSGLLLQLASDINFYQQISNHVPKITFFRHNVNVLARLEKYEKNFLCYKVFFDVLPDFAPVPDQESELPVRFKPSIWNIELYQKINMAYKQYDLRTILETEMQISLHRDVNIRSFPLATSVTVYRAQLLTETDFEKILKNPTTLFSIISYCAVSESYPTVVEICRRAIQNGLTVVLLQIKLLQGALIYQISTSPNIFVLPIASVLRSKSIIQTPDKIWRVESIYNGDDMKCFKDQLHFETKKILTRDSIKDYLNVLDQFTPINDSQK